MARLPVASAGLVGTLYLLAGCAPSVSQMLTAPEDLLAQRQLQTRQYDSADEGRVLTACTALLQDMGYQIDEGTSRLGVVLASKMRDANPLPPEARFAAGALVLASAVFTAGATLPLLTAVAESHPTRIEVAIFTRRVGPEENRIAVRVIFRETGHSNGQSGPPTIIRDATIYQEVFDRLSKALSLEARES